MKKIAVIIPLLLLLASCAKMKTAEYMHGDWAITQVDYVYADTTLSTVPDQEKYTFSGFHYTLYQQAQTLESGTFYIHPSGTRIAFTNANGTNTLYVAEAEPEYFHWRTKQVNGLSLEMYLQKIQ